MLGLLIRKGVVERVELPDDDGGGPLAPAIHAMIGDGFSTAFQLPGPGGRTLVGFCDDNGLSKPELPWNVMLHTSIYPGGWPVRGPIVVVAHIGPDAVPLTEIEAAALRMHGRFRGVIGGDGVEEEFDVPVLRFIPGYDYEPRR